MIPTIAPYVMPRALGLIRRACPELEVLLREEQTARSLELLHAGKLDALLLALEADLGDVETLPLFRDAFVFAAANGHPLAQRKWIRAEDLTRQRVLLLEDGHCLKDHALSACSRPELRAEASILGTSLHTLVQMVDNGLGITLIPEMAVEAGILAGTRVVARRLDADHPVRKIALVWRKGSPREKEFRLLADALKAAA